jgi:hypothetical protein
MTRCRNIGCNDEKDGHCIGIPCGGADTPPPVQSDQSDEDRREKSESRAGIPPFESGEERRAVDRIL